MFNFHIGKKKVSTKDMFIVSGVLAFIVSGLASCVAMPEEKIWCVVDQVTRPLNIQVLEDVKLKIDEIITCRSQKAVGDAIDKVTPEYDRIIEEANRKYRPRYVEEANDEKVCYTMECKTLAPPMRICAPWVDDCPKT
jgi:hypothetical protein